MEGKEKRRVVREGEEKDEERFRKEKDKSSWGE